MMLRKTVLKRIAWSILIVVAIVFCLTNIFCNVGEYERDYDFSIKRETYLKLDESKGMNDKEIMDFVLKVVCDSLSFSKHCNCVHYSAFYTKACNYAFSINNSKSKCVHCVGHVSCLGHNVNKFLIKHFPTWKFVKYHDFVEVYTDKYLYKIDPSVCDVTKTNMLNTWEEL